MFRNDRIILVVGATGRQGRATAAELLADGWQVRALTRDPANPVARALAAAGAEVMAGDLDDRASVAAAVQGVYGIFNVQAASGFRPGFGLDDEIRHGRHVADAAQAAGVAHLVYSSANAVDVQHDSGIPYLAAKWQIEQYLRELDIPHTVLLPAMFMENLSSTGPLGVQSDGTFAQMFSRYQPIQFVATHDIGAIAALAFADPDGYLGTRLPLAGDELTPTEVAAALSSCTGKRIEYRRVPPGSVPGHSAATGPISVDSWRRVRRADITALQAIHPGLQSFDTWLRRNRAAFGPRHTAAAAA